MNAKFKKSFFAVAVPLLFIMFFITLKDKWKLDAPLACNAIQVTEHSEFIMKAHYFMSFNRGKGQIRINGIAYNNGHSGAISRQIFFTYNHNGSYYNAFSQQVEKMSNDKGSLVNADHHLPSFFSEEGKSLAFTLKYDDENSIVIQFGGVPIFYCTK